MTTRETADPVETRKPAKPPDPTQVRASDPTIGVKATTKRTPPRFDWPAEINKELAQALVQAQIAAIGVEKTSTVADQGNRKYASVDAIASVATQVLGDAGLLVIVEYYPEWYRVDPFTVRKASGANTVIIGMTHGHLTLVHASSGARLGPFFSAMPIMWRIQAQHDKAFASSQSYLHSYMLRNVLNLPRIDEKDDVDQRRDEPDETGLVTVLQQHEYFPQEAQRTVTPAKPAPPQQAPADLGFEQLKKDTKAAAKIYCQKTSQKWGDIAVIALGDPKARSNRRPNAEQVEAIRQYIDLSDMKFDATKAPITDHVEFQQLLAGTSRRRDEPVLDAPTKIDSEDIPF